MELPVEQKPSKPAKASPKPSEAAVEKDASVEAEAAIESIEAPKDPLRDLLAEDLRDSLLEKITDENVRKQVLEQVKDEPVLEQIKFIKRYQKVKAAPVAAGQLPTGQQKVRVGFFERQPPGTSQAKQEHRWG